MITTKRCVSMLTVFCLLLVFGGSALADAAGAAQSGRININTAPAAQLVKLPRIGEKMAQRIITFREKHGRFKRIEDLLKVKGIGEKLFERLKNRITV